MDFDPEWPIIWGVFEKHYPDPATFVPSIAAVVVAWSDAFVRWLEQGENEELVDKLLEALATVGSLKLGLDVWFCILETPS